MFKNEIVRKEFNFLSNEVKKKYELNYDRAVQDLYDIRDKALAAGSFNAAISAQNSLLRVGGLIVDRKEVMFGKIDQMSRKEVETRLGQLMGNIIEIGVETKKDIEVVEEVEVIPWEMRILLHAPAVIADSSMFALAFALYPFLMRCLIFCSGTLLRCSVAIVGADTTSKIWIMLFIRVQN